MSGFGKKKRKRKGSSGFESIGERKRRMGIGEDGDERIISIKTVNGEDGDERRWRRWVECLIENEKIKTQKLIK